MLRKLLRAGSAAVLSLALIAPAARADYVGAQAGGGGNITYGAFGPTLNGVVTQLTKSVPVDPVSGQAIFTQAQPGIVTLSPNGLGAMTATPACSTNGTPLASSPPAGKRGARLYVPPGGSISFTVAAAQPSSAPLTVTVVNPSANTVPANWDEDLAGSQMIYCTASSGSPLFRWY